MKCVGSNYWVFLPEPCLLQFWNMLIVGYINNICWCMIGLNRLSTLDENMNSIYSSNPPSYALWHVDKMLYGTIALLFNKSNLVSYLVTYHRNIYTGREPSNYSWRIRKNNRTKETDGIHPKPRKWGSELKTFLVAAGLRLRNAIITKKHFTDWERPFRPVCQQEYMEFITLTDFNSFI